MVKPLLDLLKKELFFEWKEEQLKAIEDLEEKFLFAFVLKFLDFTKSFKVHTYANDFTIRRVLMQEGHLITFENKKFFETQLQWLIHLKNYI
jgi:hypothetical protein